MPGSRGSHPSDTGLSDTLTAPLPFPAPSIYTTGRKTVTHPLYCRQIRYMEIAAEKARRIAKLNEIKGLGRGCPDFERQLPRGLARKKIWLFCKIGHGHSGVWHGVAA